MKQPTRSTCSELCHSIYCFNVVKLDLLLKEGGCYTLYKTSPMSHKTAPTSVHSLCLLRTGV